MLCSAMSRKFRLRSSEHSLRRSKPVAQGIALYMTAGCPYCLKVSTILDKLTLRIRIVNPEKDQALRHKLTKQGGRYQVPCLHIDNRGEESVWMYESRDIIRYLNRHFSRTGKKAGS